LGKQKHLHSCNKLGASERFTRSGRKRPKGAQRRRETLKTVAHLSHTAAAARDPAEAIPSKHPHPFSSKGGPFLTGWAVLTYDNYGHLFRDTEQIAGELLDTYLADQAAQQARAPEVDV